MVVGDGFEPSKAELTDLQSVPFGHSGTPPQINYTNILLFSLKSKRHLRFWKYSSFCPRSIYMLGTTTSVSTVAKTSPKMITIAMGAHH